MLNEQLLKDIDLEAKAEAKKMTARVPIFRHGYEAGWYDSGEKYASLWQAAEEKAAKAQHLIDATIEKVIDLMDFVAEAKGHVSDEEIISQVRKSLPELLEALTPKTGEDEKG